MNHTQTNEVILGLLRADSENGRLPKIKDWSELDWEGILRQSLRHGIAPLLYRRLMTNFSGISIPDRIMSRFKDISLHVTAKNMCLYHELSKLMKRLRDRVPVILLKGGHLAALVYRDISLRPMVDLDLLIRKADLPEVAAAMRGLGYTQSTEDLDHPFHVAYLDPNRTAKLEIHWSLCPETSQAAALNVEDLWEGARWEMLEGNKVRILRPEHLLLHICLHDAGQHFYLCGLRTMCDIDVILRRYGDEIDWGMVASQARQWGITKSSYLSLLLARELMDTDVPEKTLTALKPLNFRPENLSWATKAILAPLSQDEPVSGSFAEFWGADRFKHKMALLLENFFPPRETMARTYSVQSNAPHLFLYYPWRLIEFWMRYGRSLRKMWNPGSEVHIGLEAEHSRILLRQWLQT